MNRALLDTDTLSEIGKARNPVIAANATTYRRAFGHYTLSAVTVAEIVRGFQRSNNLSGLNAFLASVAAQEVLDLDQAAGELAGRIAGELEHSGRGIGLADPMIAAVAIIHGLELVTGNTAHFQRIQQLGHPLILRNWRL